MLPCDTSIESYIIFLKDGILNITLGEIHYWIRMLEPSLPSLQAAKMHDLDALAKNTEALRQTIAASVGITLSSASSSSWLCP